MKTKDHLQIFLAYFIPVPLSKIRHLQQKTVLENGANFLSEHTNYVKNYSV